MLTLYAAGAALAATAAGPTLSHIVDVPHGGGTVRAVYDGTVSVRTTQRGMNSGTRIGNAQCHWAAMMDVTRKVSSGAETVPAQHVVDRSVVANGFRPGGCMETRIGVKEDVDRAVAGARRHLVTVAMRDQADLVAQLNTRRETRVAGN